MFVLRFVSATPACRVCMSKDMGKESATSLGWQLATTRSGIYGTWCSSAVTGGRWSVIGEPGEYNTQPE